MEQRLSWLDGYTVDSAEILHGGYAYVAVTAQRAGVHGMGEHPIGLVQWDPERYRTLSIPSDDYSFDIFTQAARTVSAERSGCRSIPSAGSTFATWWHLEAHNRPAGWAPT